MSKAQANRITISELSPKAQQRLRGLRRRSVDNLKAEGLSVEKATECLGIARSTYYRWQRHLKIEGPGGLAGKAGRRRPKRLRKRAWKPEGLREQALDINCRAIYVKSGARPNLPRLFGLGVASGDWQDFKLP